MPHLKHFFPDIWQRLKYSLNPKPMQGSQSIVVKLPPELLLMIAEHLDLHAKIQFYQTCSWTHSLIRINFTTEISALTNQERLEFYYQASLQRPQSWFCARCTCLHRAKEADVPYRRICDIKTCQRSYSRALIMSHRVHYDIQQRHIQLALKLSQPKFRSAHQRHLDRLMKPHSERKRLDDTFTTVIRDFSAVSRIVEGRFLMHFSYEFHKTHGRDIRLAHLVGTFICAHMHVDGYQPVGARTAHTGVDFTAKLAFIHNGEEVKGWCSCCMTDYTFQVQDGRVVIRIWHDFGSQDPPPHLQWARIEAGGRLNKYGEPLYSESGLVKERFLSQEQE